MRPIFLELGGTKSCPASICGEAVEGPGAHVHTQSPPKVFVDADGNFRSRASWGPGFPPFPASASEPTSDTGVANAPILRVPVRVSRLVSWGDRFVNWWVRKCVPSVVDDMIDAELIESEISQEMVRPRAGNAFAVVEECGLNADQEPQEVCVVPRLVAEAVVALRMKLGRGVMVRDGPTGAANLAVVRAEAAKLLRDWNVRNRDAAAHLYNIEKAFFEDDTHYRVPDWRAAAAKKSRFLRWFMGANDLRYSA